MFCILNSFPLSLSSFQNSSQRASLSGRHEGGGQADRAQQRHLSPHPEEVQNSSVLQHRQVMQVNTSSAYKYMYMRSIGACLTSSRSSTDKHIEGLMVDSQSMCDAFVTVYASHINHLNHLPCINQGSPTHVAYSYLPSSLPLFPLTHPQSSGVCDVHHWHRCAQLSRRSELKRKVSTTTQSSDR